MKFFNNPSLADVVSTFTKAATDLDTVIQDLQIDVIDINDKIDALRIERGHTTESLERATRIKDRLIALLA